MFQNLSSAAVMIDALRVNSVLFSSAIISLKKRQLVALRAGVLVIVWLLLFYVSSLRWNGLWSVIVAFSGHTRLRFGKLMS